MKHIFYFVAAFLLSAIIFFSCKNTDSSNDLNNQMDTISYCVGVVFGSNLPKEGFDTIDTKMLSRGLVDYVDKKNPLINKNRAKQILFEYHDKKQTEHILAKFGDDKTDGEKFLQENKKLKGVITLPSGLQYKILKQGNGPKPGPKDLVLVHYRGRFIDGTLFEDHKKGDPIPFFVNRVIKGWREALQRMPQGSEWEIYVPYQLGYGSEYNPNSAIPPFSALIFDLELIKIKHYK